MTRWDAEATRAAVLLDAPSLTGPRRELGALAAAAATALPAAGVEVIVLGTALPPSRSREVLPVAADLDDALQKLDARGIGPGLAVLIADSRSRAGRSASHVPRLRRIAPEHALSVIGALREARVARRVPDVDDDPAWTVRLTADPLRQRIDEAIATVGAGGFATRGAVEEAVAGRAPLMLAAGVYAGSGPDQHLLPAPLWTDVTLLTPPTAEERLLDLRTGVLARREVTAGGVRPVRSLRFASASRPGVMALRLEAGAGRVVPGPLLRGEGIEVTGSGPGREIATARGATAEVVAEAVETGAVAHGIRSLERIAGYRIRRPGARGAPPANLDAYARRGGFDQLLREQRAAWAARWARVDAETEGDPDVQRAVRFALFQLQSNVVLAGESAVGARGLSGPAYRGHVFWDADCFVLPAMLAIAPAAAMGMLEYRLRRLPQARRNAQACGRSGARFPWESADSGEDVTPPATSVGERLVVVRTGEAEEHITADVGWAAHRYLAWTGDKRAAARLRPLFVETAAYWASRILVDAAGAGHIRGVIGPDEYHVGVDDNAFTNIMARWNLRAGAAALEQAATGDGTAPAIVAEWRDLADRLVDGFDPRTCRHEQFTGYSRLKVLTKLPAGPVAADALLGPALVAASQLIKQPDVLMAHQLLPDELPPGSLDADLDHYVPRTVHGSSLSPATVAGLLARAGRPDEAVALFRHAANLDLQDRSGMTAGGLHIANLAAVWLALVGGFCGVDVRGGVLEIAPHLPQCWPSVGVRFACLGSWVRLRIDHGRVHVRSSRPLPVRIGDGPVTVADGQFHLSYQAGVTGHRSREEAPR